MRCWEITLVTLVCLLSTVCSCMRSKMDCLNTWIIALLTFIGLLPSVNHKVLCKLACIAWCECTLVAFMRYLSRFWPSHVLLGQPIFYVILFVSILWDWAEITWKDLTMYSNDIWPSLALCHDISQSWMKVKVAKWWWRRSNGLIMMHIYDKQWSIIQKINEKAQTDILGDFTMKYDLFVNIDCFITLFDIWENYLNTPQHDFHHIFSSEFGKFEYLIRSRLTWKCSSKWKYTNFRKTAFNCSNKK